MMIYVDTNVIIDFLAHRDPFYEEANELFFHIADLNSLIAYTSVKSLSDVHYIIGRSLHNKTETDRIITKLISLLYVADNTSIDLLKTYSCKTNNFEDNLISQLSKRMMLDYIVTRNVKDFDDSIVKAITPKDCLNILKLPEL